MRRDALREHIHPLAAGTGVLQTLDATRLQSRAQLIVLPAWRDWRLRDIERLAIQQWVAEKFRQQSGWQTVRNAWVLLSGILETAVEYGYLRRIRRGA